MSRRRVFVESSSTSAASGTRGDGMTSAFASDVDHSRGGAKSLAIAPRLLERAPTAGSRGGARGPAAPICGAEFGADLDDPARRDRPTIVSNFVSTLDGVIAFDHGPERGTGGEWRVHSRSLPHGSPPSDCRRGPGGRRYGPGVGWHVWTPGHVHPPSTAAFATWRRHLGLAPRPDDGHRHGQRVDRSEHPGLQVGRAGADRDDGAGADRLRRVALPPAVEVAVAGERGTEEVLLANLAERISISWCAKAGRRCSAA